MPHSNPPNHFSLGLCETCYLVVFLILGQAHIHLPLPPISVAQGAHVERHLVFNGFLQVDPDGDFAVIALERATK